MKPKFSQILKITLTLVAQLQVLRLREEHAAVSAELLRAKHQASDYERRMRDFEAALALEKRDTQVRCGVRVCYYD